MPITAVSPSWRIHSWSLVKRRIGMENSSRAAVITGRSKGHRRDQGGARHVANDERDRRTDDGGVLTRDIAHRNGGVERRAKTAAGHDADRGAGGIENGAAFARRGAVVGADADAAAGGRLGELAQDARGAGKAGFGPAALADGPGKRGLDGTCRLVDVVAVEAQ